MSENKLKDWEAWAECLKSYQDEDHVREFEEGKRQAKDIKVLFNMPFSFTAAHSSSSKTASTFSGTELGSNLGTRVHSSMQRAHGHLRRRNRWE